MKSDLHALSQLNDLFKYADDTTLFVPEHTDISISSEFDHVRTWAACNCLTLNLIKTKVSVFRRPRALSFHIPTALDNIKQVTCCKLLGVLFQSNFIMDSHVQYIPCQCSQHLYYFVKDGRLNIKARLDGNWLLLRNLLLFCLFCILFRREVDF